MEAYQERVVQEKADLDEKIQKLSDFIESEKFHAVEAEEADRMRRQLEIMGEYSNILGYRISNF